jgi:hypothetical protein
MKFQCSLYPEGNIIIRKLDKIIYNALFEYSRYI